MGLIYVPTCSVDFYGINVCINIPVPLDHMGNFQENSNIPLEHTKRPSTTVVYFGVPPKQRKVRGVSAWTGAKGATLLCLKPVPCYRDENDAFFPLFQSGHNKVTTSYK